MLPIKLCSGCTACYEVCVKKCIEMKVDKNGFKYPFIRKEQCINCHKCERICPVLKNQQSVFTNKKIKDDFFPIGYAAYNQDPYCRKLSSSGGVFTVLAEDVFSQQGIVYGAAFTEDLQVKHIGVDCKEELYRLRGSKYVQSDVTGCFSRVRTQLEQGRIVLFSGTPCQIQGLLAFLQKGYENLRTVDFICHGVPSAKVWKAYIDWLERKYKLKVISANFRDKLLGWKDFSMKIEFSDGTIYSKSQHEDVYMQAFIKNLSLRGSCYNCSFKMKKHQSDLTIADLWGIQDISPNLDDDKGTSLVLVQSERGMKLLNNISEKIYYERINTQSAIDHNGAMIKSVVSHNFRTYFFEKLGKKDFGKLVNECLAPTYIVRLQRKILKIKYK